MIKKIYNNSYLVISLYLLFSFLIDITTNLTINLSLSVGSIIRGLLLIYLIIGLLFRYKDKNNYFILSSLFIYSILYLIINSFTINNVVNITKFIYPLILLLFMFNLYKKEDKKVNRNMLTLCLLFYSLSIIFAWIIKINISSNIFINSKTVGLYASRSEVSAIISIILPYIFINLEKRINFIEIFTIFISLFASVIIGTRLPLIVFLLCLLYYLVKKLIRDIKNKKINYVNIILFILFIIAFIYKFKETPIYNDIVLKIKNLNISNPLDIFKNFETFDHFVFNKRLSFLTNINDEMISASLMHKLFGLTKVIKLVEMDFYDILYTFGIFGFIIFITVFYYIGKKVRESKNKIRLFPITFIFLISFISGHILLSPNVALVAIVIITNTLYKKKRKKILIASYNMGTGGIETASLSLIKKLNNENYDITLYLENKEGQLLKEVPNQVKVRRQKVFNTRFKVLNKTLNLLNKLKFLITNFKEYDFSSCYATYSFSSSFLARFASNNSSIYIHSDYTVLYKNDVKKINKFFKNCKLDKFRHIIFVSNEAKENLLSLYPRFIDKSIVINNFIDNNRYLELSKEKIKETKPRGKKLFLFVGRIDESSKNLTRMVYSFNLALKENNKIELWIIGSGPDEKKISKLISDLKLNKNIKMLGLKTNPYPYFKMCDYLLLTSDYEGFPVVYGEAITFKKKIISTIDVSDETIRIPNNFGYIVKKDENDIKNTIINVINHDTLKYQEINIDKVNENKLNMLKDLIEN